MLSKPYGRIERLLHWLALEPAWVRQMSFDLERTFAMPRQAAGEEKARGPVYVCGMARSGTTLLLELLERSGAFRSLTYRDMPFVLAPNLWRQLTRWALRPATLAERAHGDGMQVGFDSPEAFEEVFWRTFTPLNAQSSNYYGTGPVTADALQAFAQYQALVTAPRCCHTGHLERPSRYLSKNNNNLLRLDALASDPKATVLLVYRNPAAVARSSLRVHQRLCANQEDRFTKTYMRWLGHHEFGPQHRPLQIAVPHMNSALNPMRQDYWLDYWIAMHKQVNALTHRNIHFIDYDALSMKPANILKKLFLVLKEPGEISHLAARVRGPVKAQQANGFNPELWATAMELYETLKTKPGNIAVAPHYN